MTRTLPGVHIQWPWSKLLIDGDKTIETRSYPLPEKYQGVPLALIETPGPLGKREGITTSRIVGIIVFENSFQYKTRKSWLADYAKHRVDEKSKFAFSSEKEKWGWIVKSVERLNETKPPPKKRGIIFATACEI